MSTATAVSSLSPQEAVTALLERLPKPLHLLVAISGGSDSTGLLVALAAYRGPDLKLSAITVDHGLRSGSAAEATAVGQFCAELGVPHRILTWIGDKPTTGISAAAREARYALLCQAADDVKATAIVTGHTLDDQLETVAMRSTRGSGEDTPGLAGMAEAVLLHRRHWLLRPFLQTLREDIRDLLRQAGHGWIDDPSNEDPRYERVRTRSMQQTAEVGRLYEIQAAGLHRRMVSDAAAELLSEHAQVYRGALMQLSPLVVSAEASVLRYALSASAAVLGGREQGPSSISMDRVMEAALAPRLDRLTAGRVVFDIRRTGLYLCRESRGLPEVTVAAGKNCLWDNRFRVVPNAAGACRVGPLKLERAADEGLFPDVPRSIALRASRALPATSEAVPILAPYHRFLPQFDYKLAVTLAGLFGCDTFPLPPWNDSARKR